MLKISANSEPIWIYPAPDVRIRLRPVTIAAIVQARKAAGEVYKAATDAGNDLDKDDGLSVAAGIAMVRRLAHLGIVEWDGIGDAEGRPAPVTPANIDLALDVWPIYDAIDRDYVEPALSRQEEKNASSNSPAGTSTAVPNTATPAA